MKLPPQPWAETAGAQAILAALDGGSGATRLVGGVVRDALLGVASKDIDLATQFEPAEVMRRLQAAAIKAIPTGLAHGTVTAVASGVVMEVTTLRRDVSTDGRHATVAFTADWAEDARRRDFTINALYARTDSGEISDFHGGLDDLATRRVRFIGAPLDRIAEDHLRILRFFRFSARFAEIVDDEGLAACAARAKDLMALSRERIAGELRGLLLVADPLPVMQLMLGHAIWLPVVPEFVADRLHVLERAIAAEAAGGIAPDWVRRLAALLPTDPAVADTVAARLRLSNADRKRVGMAAVPWTGGDPLPQAWQDGNDVIIDRLLIAGEPELAQRVANWKRPRFAIGGRDLLARGVPPGPAVSRLLSQVEAQWVAAGFPDDPARVAALLDTALAAARAEPAG